MYNPSIEQIKGGSNINYLKLSFHKENFFYKNKFQVILPSFVLESLEVIYGFGARYIYGRYIPHYMLDLSLFWSKISRWKFPTIMLSLLDVFFNMFILIDEVKISNIIFYPFLFAMIFKFTLTNEKYSQYLWK